MLFRLLILEVKRFHPYLVSPLKTYQLVDFNSATVAPLDLCAIFITNFGINKLFFNVIGFLYIDV
ncbi:MAG: hypothetical protein PWQ53_220 [Bacteroidota bacterium]|nr:hypothetical protein [Bacteroidota bacterium]